MATIGYEIQIRGLFNRQWHTISPSMTLEECEQIIATFRKAEARQMHYCKRIYRVRVVSIENGETRVWILDKEY